MSEQFRHMLNILYPGLKLRVGNEKVNFLISHLKHMLWVLKRTVSMRWFF